MKQMFKIDSALKYVRAKKSGALQSYVEAFPKFEVYKYYSDKYEDDKSKTKRQEL